MYAPTGGPCTAPAPSDSFEVCSGLAPLASCRDAIQGHFDVMPAGMDDACIRRHLSARKRDCQKAASQLQDTIDFRQELQVPQLHRDMFHDDLQRGLLYIAGHLSTGEPVMVRACAAMLFGIFAKKSSTQALPSHPASCTGRAAVCCVGCCPRCGRVGHVRLAACALAANLAHLSASEALARRAQPRRGRAGA